MKLPVLVLATLMAMSVSARDIKSESADSSPLRSETFAGLSLRGIGPAMISGRVADLAVDPSH
ncbi:MAG: hypothetical protein KDI66_20125, partial [Xanthomonadales bacterium]|nr:hypothetical protein [Xanthomonadales bacterium]